MAILFIYFIMILFIGCHSKLIGTVNRTRFTSMDGYNSESIWINHQYSPKECLCTVLSQYKDILLFNSYLNGSCQLFLSFPYTYRMEYNIDSTLILLSSLPSVTQAPCCSNLTWLITRINDSALARVSLNAPTYLVVDDLDYLAVISFNNKLYRYNRTTMTQIQSYSVASGCVSVSYYNSQYFVGCGTGNSSKFYVLSTATLASITNITVPSDPRDVVFIRDGSVMIGSVAGTNCLAFYNVTSPATYTLTSTIVTPNPPYALYRINDTFLYVTTFVSSSSVHRLIYNDATNTWSLNRISTIAGPNSTTPIFQTIFDACGRMWISVRGYGIRIFDSTGTTSLYNWTISSSLNGIALTKHFDLHAAEFYNNKILSYRPEIEQCTS